MTRLGFAVLGLALAASPALAQPAPPGPPAQQQQATAPASGEFNNLLNAIGASRQVGQHIDALGPLPEDRVELRDAYQIEQGGNADQLRSALNDNRQSVQDLRQSLVKNKSVDLALSRDQVPLDHVVAANVDPDGKVVVYAYPQTEVPPQ